MEVISEERTLRGISVDKQVEIRTRTGSHGDLTSCADRAAALDTVVAVGVGDRSPETTADDTGGAGDGREGLAEPEPDTRPGHSALGPTVRGFHGTAEMWADARRRCDLKSFGPHRQYRPTSREYRMRILERMSSPARRRRDGRGEIDGIDDQRRRPHRGLGGYRSRHLRSSVGL